MVWWSRADPAKAEIPQKQLERALLKALASPGATESNRQCFSLAQELMLASRRGWLGLYADEEGFLVRVAWARSESVGPAPDSRAFVQAAPGLPVYPVGDERPILEGPELDEDLIAELPPEVPLAEAKENAAQWLELSGGAWLKTSRVEPIRQSLSVTKRLTLALAHLVRAGATTLLRRRRLAQDAAGSAVESEVLRAAHDTSSAVELFLDAALAGLSGRRGVVVTRDQQGRALRRCWCNQGNFDPQLPGLQVEKLGEYWQAFVIDPVRLAPGASSVYSFARETRNGVAVVVVASEDHAAELDEVTERRVEHALRVICGLVEADAEAKQAKRRGLQLLRGIVQVLDAEEAGGRSTHHQRVQKVALWAASALELSVQQREMLASAASFHDVGRAPVGVDADSTASEFLHPASGAQLAQAMGADDEVVRLIRLHHERADGLGFPAASCPDEDDRTAWALIFAEAFVEAREKRATEIAEWLNGDGARVLPPSIRKVLSRYHS